jgi:hypothetical protein
MSPEIGLSQGATLASDVYSFGVLLYEMVTLEKPYKKYTTRTEFIADVFRYDYRPWTTSIPSRAIRDLITNCWDKDKTNRPSMKTVANILRVETAFLNNGQQIPLQHNSDSSRSNKDILQQRDDNMNNTSALSLSGFGSSFTSSFLPLTRRSSTPSIPTRNISTTSCGSLKGIMKKSFANKTASFNKMRLKRSSSNENFVWNTPATTSTAIITSQNNNNGKQQHDLNDTSSTANASFSSINGNNRTPKRYDRARRRSLGSLKNNKSGSASSQMLHGIEEVSGNSSSNNIIIPKRNTSTHLSSTTSQSSIIGGSFESNASLCSTDDYSMNMSKSNFTLGELRPLSRNSIFSSSISSTATTLVDDINIDINDNLEYDLSYGGDGGGASNSPIINPGPDDVKDDNT